MKLSYITNIILAIIIITLFWLNASNKPEITHPTTFSGLNQLDVESITIERQQKEVIKLQKTAIGWQLIKPFKAKANATRIALLLSLLNQPSYKQLTITDELDLTQFGLKNPQLTLQLNDAVFYFGGKEPLYQQKYIRFNNMIYIINDDITPMLTAAASSFIDNRLLPAKLTLTRISLPAINHSPLVTSKLTLFHSENGWQATLNGDGDVNQDTIVSIVQAWKNAYALQVMPISEQIPSDQNNAEVLLWFDEKPTTPLRLHLELTGQALLLTNSNSNLQYQFPISLLQQLFIRQRIEN